MREKVVVKYPPTYVGRTFTQAGEDILKHLPVGDGVIGGILALPISLPCGFILWGIDKIREKLSQRIEEEYTLVDGNKEGEYRSYYRNGHLKEIRHYRADYLSGPAKKYYENGDLRLECTYVSGGAYIGEFKEYYPGNRIKKEVYYDKKGIIDGPIKLYDEQGNMTSFEVWQHGYKLSGEQAKTYLFTWEDRQLEHDPKWTEIKDKLAHLTDETYYPPIKPARTPERTEKVKKLIKVRRGAELLASAIKEAKAANEKTLLTALKRLAQPRAEKEMAQRRVFSRIRELRKLRRKQRQQ